MGLGISLETVRPIEAPSCVVDTNESRSTSICLACGDTLSPALARSASLRCHDCRDAAAPIRADLLERLPGHFRRRLKLRSAA
jgi:hypothetical protein